MLPCTRSPGYGMCALCRKRFALTDRRGLACTGYLPDRQFWSNAVAHE